MVDLAEKSLCQFKNYMIIYLCSIQRLIQVIPLKFYEYIQASNPILCVGGINNSEVKQIIRKIKRHILETLLIWIPLIKKFIQIFQ